MTKKKDEKGEGCYIFDEIRMSWSKFDRTGQPHKMRLSATEPISFFGCITIAGEHGFSVNQVVLYHVDSKLSNTYF